MMTKTPEDKIRAASNTIISDTVLWAAPYLNLRKVPSNSVQTMCTDGIEIKWNPEYVETLTTPEVFTVLCHETLHCVMGHMWRLDRGRYPDDIIQQAADEEANWILQEYNLYQDSLPENKRNSVRFVFPGKPFLSEEFRGMACERIAEILLERRRKNKINSGESCKQSNASGLKANVSGEGNDGNGSDSSRHSMGESAAPQCTEDGDGSRSDSAHHSMGEFTTPQCTGGQLKELKERWKSILVQAKTASLGRGEMPSKIKNVLDDILTPPVPWLEVLRNYMNMLSKEDYSWRKPNRRYCDSGFVVPSLYSESLGVIGIARDQSGSISNDVAARFCNATQLLLADCRPEKLIVVDFDIEAHPVGEFSATEQIPRVRQCCGGTSFIKMFKYFEDLPDRPACVIVLTDTDGLMPRNPPSYDVIWAVVGKKEWKPPFGTCLFLDETAIG